MEKVEFKKVESLEVQEYRKEIYKKIFEDKKIWDILINEFELNNQEIFENLAKVNDFYNNYYLTMKLNTFEACKKANVFQSFILEKNGNTIEKRYSLLEPVLNKLKFDHALLISDLEDEDYRTIESDFKPSDFIRGIVNKAINNIKNKNWIYLYGAPNTGKKIISLYVIKYLLKINEYERNIVFIDFPKRIKELSELFFSKSQVDKEEYNRLFKVYCETDIMVFNDFGDGYLTEFVKINILIPILEKRHSLNLKTIFISKYKFEHIKTIYASDSKSGEIKMNYFFSWFQNKIGNDIVTSEIENLY